MLVLREVKRSFGGARERSVLNGVNFELARGEYVAITGESGSGKSTLLNLIAGLDVADSGSVEFAGHNLASLNDDERTALRRSKMGFVFQAFHLQPHLTVAANVSLPLALNGDASVAGQARVQELLVAMNLGDRAHSYPRELSGGEMQRVGVARALVHRPALVLADEPTGNLDADAAHRVLDMLRTQLSKDGSSGILVTHSAQAAATTQRIYCLSDAGLKLC
jgi:putative ABC transport system ATP-binding protein